MDLLAQMVTFLRIADGRSLSAAARAQRLSLPAISRQLRGLESELGVALVVRSTRRLHLTDAGQRFYRHCQRVLHEVDAMRDAVRGTKAVRGVLVVSASFSFGTRLIVPRLRALLDKHPGLIVDLRLEDKIVDLVAEGVDVAVRAGSPPPDSTAFVAHEIRSMRRILVAAPRVVRKHGAPKTPDDLAKLPCLLQVTPQGALVRWTLHRGDEQRIVDVDGPVRTNAPITLREFALDGLGVAYVPDWLVNDDVDAGRLRRLLPEWSSHPIMGWAIHRSELRGSPRVRAFVEAMAAP